jgi:hypothetical protein
MPQAMYGKLRCASSYKHLGNKGLQSFREAATWGAIDECSFQLPLLVTGVKKWRQGFQIKKSETSPPRS